MKNKLLSLMGIAMKARKLEYGYDTVSKSIISKNAKLIIMASDLSQKSKRNIVLLSEKYKVETLDINITMDEVYKSIGRKTGIVCINDVGFAEKILEFSGI